MKQSYEYIGPIRWLLLLTVTIVFSMELLSTYVGTQGHIEAVGGTGVLLSLVGCSVWNDGYHCWR